MALIRTNKAGSTASKSWASISNPITGNDNCLVYSYNNSGVYFSSVITNGTGTASDLINISYSGGNFTLTLKADCHLKVKSGSTEIDEAKTSGFTFTWSRDTVSTIIAYIE